MLLQKVGISVDLANNGKEGFEKFIANQTKYDFILMDLQMPIMSGYEATQKIREYNKTIPIIALTAAAMIEDKQKALEAGMNEHLGKPIDQNELYKTISKFTAKEFSFQKTTTNSNSVLDLDFLQHTLSSQEIINSLLITFKKQLTTGEFRNIVELVKNQDKEALNLIHTLKGVSGNLGANELLAITELINHKYKTNTNITQNDITTLEVSIQNILKRLNDIKDEHNINVTHNKKSFGDDLQKLIILIKQSLANGDLIEDDLKLELISSLYGIVDNGDLEKFKSYIEEFEFDKALEIINGWNI
jgi:two-component system, sensor histidine kinase and response regulator